MGVQSSPSAEAGGFKRLGWKWDKTRRTDPARVQRHWLVLPVAVGVEDAHDRRIYPGNLRKPASSFSPGMLPGSWANPDRRVLGLMWLG